MTSIKEALNQIKRTALDAQPKDVPKALAHIVRLCIDASAQLESADARETIAQSVRDYCRSVSPASIQDSHGVERIYYAGLPVFGLVDAILATGHVPDELSKNSMLCGALGVSHEVENVHHVVGIVEGQTVENDTVVGDDVAIPVNDGPSGRGLDHVECHGSALDCDKSQPPKDESVKLTDEASIRADEREKCANICRQVGINAGRRAAEYDNDGARYSALDKMEGAIQCEAAIQAGRAEG